MEWATFKEQDRTSNAERHVSWVRFILVLFNIVVYYTLLYPMGVTWLAAGVSVVAGLYGALVVILRPYQIIGIMRSSYWTTGTDAVLIVLWILATGAASSPFFLLWTVSLVAIGYRYGPKATVNATAMYVLLEAAFLASGGILATAQGAIRLAYIAFTGTVMAFASGYALFGIQKQEALEELVDDLAEAKGVADEAQTRMEIILHNAPSIIFEVDLDGRITYINRVVEGLTKEQVIGQSAASFMVADSKDLFQSALDQVILHADSRTVEVQGLGPGMDVHEYRTHMGPLTDGHGHVRGAILITVDVTDEKRKVELARETERHKENVERLEEEAKFRSRFINTAAHELNTPMTPLRLQMGILRQVLGDSHVELRAVDIMERNLVRLGGLVTDLLDSTRLQEGQMRWNPISMDVSMLMGEAAATFDQVARDRGVFLEVGADPGTTVYADPQRVSQVIYNLLSNALKFTPAGGRVQCEALTNQDGHVEVLVTDTGPGFTDEEAARLFLPFSQVHPSPIPEEPGTGLGLYLSRDLAQAQGGSLDVSSPGRGKGATFRLTLPKEPPSGEEEE